MEKEEFINRLKNIVGKYAQNHEALASINERTDFINDLKINSANLVDVVLDIEEEFDITIENEAMEKMLNVGISIEVIEERMKGK